MLLLSINKPINPQIWGGGQPNSTQFMPMPILRFECGIGINWHKLAHFFDSYMRVLHAHACKFHNFSDCYDVF